MWDDVFTKSCNRHLQALQQNSHLSPASVHTHTHTHTHNAPSQTPPKVFLSQLILSRLAATEQCWWIFPKTSSAMGILSNPILLLLLLCITSAEGKGGLSPPGAIGIRHEEDAWPTIHTIAQLTAKHNHTACSDAIPLFVKTPQSLLVLTHFPLGVKTVPLGVKTQFLLVLKHFPLGVKTVPLVLKQSLLVLTRSL